MDFSTLMQVTCPDHVEGLCIGNLFCIYFFAMLIDMIFVHIRIFFCLLKASGKHVFLFLNVFSFFSFPQGTG